MAKRGRKPGPARASQLIFNKWCDKIKHTKKAPTGAYPIESRIITWEEKDKELWDDTVMDKEMPDIKFVRIYAVKNKKVELIGYNCTQCNKIFKDPDVVKNHKNVCKKLNKSNKESN